MIKTTGVIDMSENKKQMIITIDEDKQDISFNFEGIKGVDLIRIGVGLMRAYSKMSERSFNETIEAIVSANEKMD